MRSPRLVAESLRDVPDATATALPPPRGADAPQQARLLDAAMQPTRFTGPPPAFLRVHQVDSWRRVMAALEAWRGALLAEPVGAGKTWIALAVAARWGARCTVVGPASLASQWRLAAHRAGVAIAWHSYERLSRGQPPPSATLVILDEAHRLRHHDTQRVRTLAPWLVGRCGLMLTATPIVNRRRDLMAILSLVVGDDALSLDGIPSLAVLAASRSPPMALRRLVIRSAAGRPSHPVRQHRLRAEPFERVRAARIATVVASLSLSDDPAVRQLLGTVLLDAGASSDAAWHAALRRYRALLMQSRDAGGASRADLRRFAGPALDQLVLWPMLGDLDTSTPPPLDDLPRTERALQASAMDHAWIRPLACLLADGRVTACFCRHRATAAALARALGDDTAWVTGDAAGIGAHRMPRDDLLGAFGPDRDAWRLRRRTPTVLVATEVLAEGLDLQGASRVVHVDLPWHATRLEQRTGRVRRPGQRAADVEVVHRAVPRALERLLGMRRRIRLKGGTAERWLRALELGEPAVPQPDAATWISVELAARGADATAWVMLVAGKRSGCMAMSVSSAGSITTVPHGSGGVHVLAAQGSDLHRGRAIAAIAVRHALGAAVLPASGRSRFVARILQLARTCAARRDHEAMVRLDRLLSVVLAPGSRGVDLLLDRLLAVDDDELMRAPLPPAVQREPVIVRWVAVTLYRQPGPPLA